MCGICGIFDLKGNGRVDHSVIDKMVIKLLHRGPDGVNSYITGNLAFGFSRLSIIDLEGGMQPILNEDKSLILICNGEIFNYIELREELVKKGHKFGTQTDVETLIHLYEEYGTEFPNQLNGQFAFALFDLKKQILFCARDHFGILPFFYTVADGLFIFASEIKALLEHPLIKKEMDMSGLDQIFSFPGLISPRTMFKNIKSLENGHYLIVTPHGNIVDREYWDLYYPELNQVEYQKDENYYIERLQELITRSVRLRLRSDVPIGLYISGGLDSSIITALTSKLTPQERRSSFSINFLEKEISESKYQKMMSKFANTIHNEILFMFTDISSRLPKAIYHSECPIKETYNTASLALSELVNKQKIKVILTGEGADEFFAGYVGYRFDKLRRMKKEEEGSDTVHEKKIREKLWQDKDFFYEKNHYSFSRLKKELYSDAINENFVRIDCLNHFIIDGEKLKNRDILHKRSYLDYKLRLVDHLISDHGDRMALANSVEARYPFLDKDLVEFAALIPPVLKLKDFEEKYILKKVAQDLIPGEIVHREKFGFVAPGSSYLLKQDIEYIKDLLSYETIKRQGIFNPDTVEKLKTRYCSDGFTLNVPFDSDFLIIVITLGIFQEQFQMTGL